MAATGPLPSGFTSISQPPSANETAGFSLAVTDQLDPVGTSGYQTYLKDPAEPNTNILIDLTPHTYPNDMLREARYIEARSSTRIPRLPPARPGSAQHPRYAGLLLEVHLVTRRESSRTLST